VSNLEENGHEILKKVERTEEDEIYENLKKQTENLFLEDENEGEKIAVRI